MEQLKKGVQNPLEEAQVRRAVVALQTFLEKKKEDQHKKPLVENTEYLSCIITRKTIPVKGSLKPVQMYVALLYAVDMERLGCSLVPGYDI